MLSIVKQSVKQKFDVNPTISYNFERKLQAGVAESADAADLKSAGEILVGSSPTPGSLKVYLTMCWETVSYMRWTIDFETAR